MVILATAAACDFEPSFDQTRYRCGVGDACPSGFSCIRSFCESGPTGVVGDPSPTPAPEADADPGAPDAGVDASASLVDAAPGAGPDAAPAGGSPDAAVAATFQDGFGDGASTGWIYWDHPGCTVTETGGFLALSYVGTGNAYCGADTEQRFDLRGASISVEAAAAPVLVNFETYVVLFSGQQQILMIRGQDGLTMMVKNNGSVAATKTIANDLAAHRFWRVREQGGTLFWETSPDGVTYTRRFSTAVTIDVTSLVIELAAGHYSPGPGAAVVVRYDNLVVR